MGVTAKIRAACEALERRLMNARRQRGNEKARAMTACRAVPDRLQFTASAYPKRAILDLPGYRRTRSHWLRQRTAGGWQAYGRVEEFQRKGSAMRFCVLSEPRKPWLAPCRVEFRGDDATGLMPGEVLPVLEVLPDVRLSLVEVAIDFPLGDPVTAKYVRRHALFGRSKPRSAKEQLPNWDAWGSRKGSKFVRSYFKQEIHAHRVEFELRSRFLRHYRINDVFDFARLAELLARQHILFARLDDQKLAFRLRGGGLSAGKTLRLLREVADRERDLWAALHYLRRTVGLKNVRRFLVRLPVNRLIREALVTWAAKWPATPRGLKKRSR